MADNPWQEGVRRGACPRRDVFDDDLPPRGVAQCGVSLQSRRSKDEPPAEAMLVDRGLVEVVEVDDAAVHGLGRRDVIGY